jgi:hypothetical protein
MLPHFNQTGPARVVVKQADDDVPHDRTSLFDRGQTSWRSFPDGFARLENGFVGHRLNDAAGRTALASHPVAELVRHLSPQIPDSPAGFLESWRGHAAYMPKLAGVI